MDLESINPPKPLEVDEKEAIQMPVYSLDINDWGQPGVILVVDAETAESMGAFEETALSPEDAWESTFDPREDYGHE